MITGPALPGRRICMVKPCIASIYMAQRPWRPSCAWPAVSYAESAPRSIVSFGLPAAGAYRHELALHSGGVHMHMGSYGVASADAAPPPARCPSPSYIFFGCSRPPFGNAVRARAGSASLHCLVGALGARGMRRRQDLGVAGCAKWGRVEYLATGRPPRHVPYHRENRN